MINSYDALFTLNFLFLPFLPHQQREKTLRKGPCEPPPPPPLLLHPAFLDLSLPGVCMGLKGHSLHLTALVWKPGSDCGLCLALCKARAVSFSSGTATV